MTCKAHRPRPVSPPKLQPSGFTDTVLECEACGKVSVRSEFKHENYTTQERLIRACGEGICAVVKNWKPAIATQRCQYCGRKFYHVAEHEDKCCKLTDEERWQQFCDETGFRFRGPRQLELPLDSEEKV